MEQGDFSNLVNELLLYDLENEWIEFKENNTDPQLIGEYISALSNSACFNKMKFGYLIYGIEDKTKRVTGTKFRPRNSKGKGNENLEPWLLRLLNPNIDFEILEGKYKGRDLVIFKIDSARVNPVRFNGIEYIRVGEYKKKLRDYPEKERKLWKILDNLVFEEGVALEKIDESLLLDYFDYPKYFELNKLSLPENRSSIISKFLEENFVIKKGNKYSITNLGAILFAKDLDKFSKLSRKKVRVIFYDGADRLSSIREKEHKQGYAVLFESLIDYVTDQLPHNEIIEKALRKEVLMYPVIAIRELVANTLIHQDFSISGTGPTIEFFSNRIEFTNPGKPLIDPARFIDHKPQSRNDKLASFMRRIKICEELGSGVDKVVGSVEIFQLPAPEFNAYKDFTQVVLYSHKDFSKMNKDDKIRACYQHCSLKNVSKEFMTNQSLRERFNLDKTKYTIISRIISDTIKAGMIRRDNSNRYIPFWA